MDIEQLEQSIKYYAEKYYSGFPEISDAEFDNLVDKLRSLKPDSTVLKTGWGFEVNGDKVKHKYSHIGSLDKTKTYEDIPDRFKNKQVYMSPKLDGLSAVAYYKNGKLVKGITRGNGEYGKDITNKLSIILGNSIQDTNFTGGVRGELIISDNNWKVLQGKYNDLIAPRNFAAGIINRKEIDEDIQYIDLVVYKIVGQENTASCKDRNEVLNWLAQNFKHCIPNYYYPVLNKESWEMYHENTFDEFRKLGYGLDGLVLTSPDVQYLATVENETHIYSYMYNEVAFKFQAETSETIVKEIEWDLSRTQRLVPVCVVEPVELSGAIINRCTANNAKMVQDLGLGSNAKVEIMRSNEVIPCIVKVLEESEEQLPTVCPVCKQPLTWVGVDLKCENPDCNNIKLSDLQQWCEVIGETDGLQWSTMKQFLDLFTVKSLEDLYDKQKWILMYFDNRQLSITEQKIKVFFEKLFNKDVDIEKALMALNIPRLGIKTTQTLSKNPEICKQLIEYGTNKENLKQEEITVLFNKLWEIVKTATTTELQSNQLKLQHLKYIKDRIILKEKQVTQDIQYIAVTGALKTMKRKDFESYINKYGYELSTNLKKCKYLVNNDINSTSTKNKQAKEYEVPIITEQEFLDKINQ